MPLKNKILPFFLLFVWVFQSLFSILYFEAQKKECWNNFAFSIEKQATQNIVTLNFPKNSTINWEKKNKEFKLNGRMYDVVSLQETADYLIIKCIADKHEDGLISAYSLFQKTQKNKENKGQLSSSKKLDYIKEASIALPSISSLVQTTNYLDYRSDLLIRANEIVSPPPQGLLF